MKKNKIKKYLSISLILAFILPAFTARADLVDDLIKKHKLDPKNNPKHQCDLMFKINKMIEQKEFNAPNCQENICSIPIDLYSFYEKEKRWYGFIQLALIYYKDSLTPIGVAMEEEFYNKSSVKDLLNLSSDNYVKENNMMYLVDIHFHERFKISRQQLPNNDFDDGSLSMAHTNSLPKDSSYVKARVCYVDKFFIKSLNNNFKKNNL